MYHPVGGWVVIILISKIMVMVSSHPIYHYTMDILGGELTFVFWWVLHWMKTQHEVVAPQIALSRFRQLRLLLHPTVIIGLMSGRHVHAFISTQLVVGLTGVTAVLLESLAIPVGERLNFGGLLIILFMLWDVVLFFLKLNKFPPLPLSKPKWKWACLSSFILFLRS